MSLNRFSAPQVFQFYFYFSHFHHSVFSFPLPISTNFHRTQRSMQRWPLISLFQTLPFISTVTLNTLENKNYILFLYQHLAFTELQSFLKAQESSCFPPQQ